MTRYEMIKQAKECEEQARAMNAVAEEKEQAADRLNATGWPQEAAKIRFEVQDLRKQAVLYLALAASLRAHSDKSS
jgi:hypothetical protein